MDKKDEQALLAARLYYEEGLSQQEVAQIMGLSRPTVAKLMTYAKERGFVIITIRSPQEEYQAQAEALEKKFGLTQVRLAPSPHEASANSVAQLGEVGAQLFSEILRDGTKVGISWGNTMYAMAQALLKLGPLPVSDVQIIQLKGGHSHTNVSTYDLETITAFTQATRGVARPLPLPIFFDNPTVKELVEAEPNMAAVLKAGRTCDMAVFTVGNAQSDHAPLNLGYLTQAEINRLQSVAVGDACSRFYTKTGQIADREIDRRTVGISLTDLASRPQRLLLAGGREKHEAIACALQMHLATHLVVDTLTASYLLSI